MEVRLTPLCAVLPRPANRRRIRKPAVEIAHTRDILLAAACRLHVVVHVGRKHRERSPSVNNSFRTFALRQALCAGNDNRATARVLLDPVTEAAKTNTSTLDTIALPVSKYGSQCVGECGVRVVGCAQTEELSLDLRGFLLVRVEDVVDVAYSGLDVA